MRKLLLSVLLAVSLQAMAEDFGFLTFTKGDGTAQSLAVSDLNITFSAGVATVTNGTETATFNLSELANMYFSAEAISTGISDVTAETAAGQFAGEVSVYAASGVFMGTYSDLDAAQSQLPRGIYIMKSNSITKKIAVK